LKSAAGEPERLSQPEAEPPSAPEAEPASAQVERVSLPEVRASMTDLEQTAAETPPRSFDAPAPPSDSGVRQRVPGPVSAPTNREELLARLRQRRQTG